MLISTLSSYIIKLSEYRYKEGFSMQLRKELKTYVACSCLCFIVVFLMSVSMPVYAAEKSVVYTSFTGSLNDTSGDGTKGNPYNRFEDAVKNVADGGTIYILASNGAFLNEQETDKPFIFNKSVTIEPEPGAERASLTSRTAGMLLEGDVTFKNIELGFANKYHDQIFANGYKLTLTNVSRNSTCRRIDLITGGLYGTDGVKMGTKSGKKGQIIVQGTSSEFGNIYAGSLNGPFEGESYITVQNTSSKKIGEVYACGAAEAYFDKDDLFDQTEAPEPVPDAVAYPVAGEVQIRTVDTSITRIDGAGAAGGTTVSFATFYPEDGLALYNISALKVEKGILKPATLTVPAGAKINLSLSENGTLDLAAFSDIEVNDFLGGGRIILGKSAVMKITGAVTGKTVFETTASLYTYGYSGIALENHVYMETGPESKGMFSFIPDPYNDMQKNLQLVREENGNWKVVKNTGSNIFFSYWTKDESMGMVSRDWETFVYSYGASPLGAEAVAKTGYHFVEWRDEKGKVVGTESQYIPTRYYETHCFEAVFEKDAESVEPPTEGDKEPTEPPKEEDKEPTEPPVEEDNKTEESKPDDNISEEIPSKEESNSEDTTLAPPETVIPTPPEEEAPAEETLEAPSKITPQLVTGLKAGKITYNSVTLTWKAQQEGIRYYVYRSTKKSSGYKKIATVSKNSYTNKKLTTGKRYYYKVKAFVDGNIASYSKIITATPIPEQPKVTLKKGKRYVIVKFPKVSGAHGYEIYRSTKKSKGYKRIVTTKKTSYKDTDLKAGKKYYYKVRAYRKVKGKKIYSEFGLLNY